MEMVAAISGGVALRKAPPARCSGWVSKRLPALLAEGEAAVSGSSAPWVDFSRCPASLQHLQPRSGGHGALPDT